MSDANRRALAAFADGVVEGFRNEPLSEDELIERLTGARAILQLNGSGTNEITERVLRAVGTVEAVVLAHSAWSGDLWRTAAQCGVKTVEGSNAVDLAVAEWTVGVSILGMRRLLDAGASLKGEGVWQKDWQQASLLYGSTVGLLGLGRIGRIVSRYFRTLGTRVIAYDKYMKPSDAERLGVTLVGLEELLRTADVVSLHLPVTPETSGLLGAREFGLIKDGAVLVNSARAALYDEAALANELRKERFHAFIDVFSQEPLPAEHPFRTLKNVFISSHVAGTNAVMYERCGADAVETLRLYFEGKGLRDMRYV